MYQERGEDHETDGSANETDVAPKRFALDRVDRNRSAAERLNTAVFGEATGNGGYAKFMPFAPRFPNPQGSPRVSGIIQGTDSSGVFAL